MSEYVAYQYHRCLFTYKISDDGMSSSLEHYTEQLNELGSQGWEVVSVLYYSTAPSDQVAYLNPVREVLLKRAYLKPVEETHE